MKRYEYLEGLNSLRFFAAFFVIISHAGLSLGKLGLQEDISWAFLNRGADAVDFFFTLSGFLITYLLLQEAEKTGTISVKNFYLRRVFRIWPLYYLIMIIGFLLLGVVYPLVYHKPYFDFSIWQGLLMFIFFIPNYAAYNFQVGLLFPLWSIGVEEQFYLFWAPLFRRFHRYVFRLILFFIILSFSFFLLVYYDYKNDIFSENLRVFFLSMKFYEMALGAMFAYLLFKYPEKYSASLFSNKIVQGAIVAVILWHYLVGFSFSYNVYFKLLLSCLYGLLVLNVSVLGEKRLFRMDNKIINYLGIISYGLYMYHMTIDYVLRLSFEKLLVGRFPAGVLAAAYYLLLLGITIAVAAFSYRFLESRFLALKDRLHKKIYSNALS